MRPALTRMRSRYWNTYVDVNRRFAEAVNEIRGELPFSLPTARAGWSAGHAALDAQTFSRWLDAGGHVHHRERHLAEERLAHQPQEDVAVLADRPQHAQPVEVAERLAQDVDALLLELVEVEQQTRQDREERALGQAAANKELIRNLAHEIKNPLGGIRGAAQLLEMEVESRALTEYTQVIINEADRLQALVDRLLAPHRKPHVVSDVNIHEVCERVRSLILAEFPRGLTVQRDYDTSIPEFRGDREQLIQAVLNIAHNAAQALTDRIAEGDASITLRTRIARQVTLGKQRYRLALDLHIEDNGPGIPESIRDRIFYPLVSGRDGGSGLGLTLAQTFVQQHQGMIECESQPGQTLFKIVIPLP